MAKEIVQKVILAPIILVLLLVVSPILILIWLFHHLNGFWLNYRFRRKWKPKNKNILFVYSESPNWQQYIENNIAPEIDKRAVFINWSKRSEWRKKKPLEAKVLFHWGGDSEFNPMAVIFEPNGKVRTIRFLKAFKDYKHGKDGLLKKREAELYGYLE